MDESVDAALRFGALQLALVTAAIHLWVGWQRLFVYIDAGTPLIDPLQVLFVLSSLAVLAGVGLAARGLRRDATAGGRWGRAGNRRALAGCGERDAGCRPASDAFLLEEAAS